MGKLNNDQGIVSQLLSDPQLAEDISQTAASASVWGGQVTQGEGTLGKLSTDPAPFNRALALMKKGEHVLTSLEARLDRLSDVIVSTDALIQKVNQGDGTAAQLVNNPDLYNQVHATAEKMERFTDRAQSGEGIVGKLVSDPTLAKHITSSTESVAALTEKLNTPGNTLDKLATSSDLLDDLLSATNRLEAILTKVNGGEGSFGKLTNDKQTAENLSQLIANLKTLAADIQANPQKYVEFSLF